MHAVELDLGDLLVSAAPRRLGVRAQRGHGEHPPAGGLLTGKHRPGAPTEGTRFTLGRSKEMYQERYWNDAMFESVESIRAVAGGVLELLA